MFTKTLHLTNAYHEHSGGIRTMYHALLEQANREHRLMRLIVPASADGMERVGRFGVIYTILAPRAPVVDRRYRRRRVANALFTARQFSWPAAASRIFQTYDRVHSTRVAPSRLRYAGPSWHPHLTIDSSNRSRK